MTTIVDADCMACGRRCWVTLSERYDYDGFRCWSCDTEQLWPDWELEDTGYSDYGDCDFRDSREKP